MNDPNGLVFAGGRFRLFAQHSVAAPDFRTIGWARLSSDDLLRWEWDGQVIPPDELGLAYSGSVQSFEEEMRATLTRHDRNGPIQRQVQMVSKDGGETWRQDRPPLGPQGRNVRDPFLTSDGRMLLAEPCDWTGWRDDSPSTLSIWREAPGMWARCGVVGPWSPSGVMWEVPILIDFDEAQALVISTVDRRFGGARCAVKAWIGEMQPDGFMVRGPQQGQALDLGPDFYAAIPNDSGGWPLKDQVIIAWASQWNTARRLRWSAGIHGGPITLPRVITLEDGRIRITPLPIALPLATDVRPLGTGMVVTGEDCDLILSVEGSNLRVTRRPGPILDWDELHEGVLLGPQTATIFVDAGLVEIFLAPADISVTASVPGAQLR